MTKVIVQEVNELFSCNSELNFQSKMDVDRNKQSIMEGTKH